MNDVLPAPRQDVLPRGVRVAIVVLVLVALAGTAIVRLAGIDIREPDAPAVQTRLLRFADAPDGSIVITDARTGEQAARVSGEQGFLRGALRALARERRAEGVGAMPAFELIQRADGRLTLADPSTGRRIDLESFGPTNAGTFARLLQGSAAPTPQQ